VSVMCFFVVRVSQIGVERSSASSSSSVGRRLCFSDVLDASAVEDLMCDNSAFEAFSVW